jgi:ferredoxin
MMMVFEPLTAPRGSSAYMSVAAAREELETAMQEAAMRKFERGGAPEPMPEPPSVIAAREACERRAAEARAAKWAATASARGGTPPSPFAFGSSGYGGGRRSPWMPPGSSGWGGITARTHSPSSVITTGSSARYTQAPLSPQRCAHCDYCAMCSPEGALPYRPRAVTAEWRVPYKIPSPQPTSARARPSWPWPATSPGVTAKFSPTPQSPRVQAKLFHSSWAIPNGPSEWHNTPLCPLPY